MKIKAADAELDWPITYVLATGETIETATWSVEPAGELAVKEGSEDISGATVSCLLTGGERGKRYDVTCRVVTNQGRKDPRTVTFLIGPAVAV